MNLIINKDFWLLFTVFTSNLVGIVSRGYMLAMYSVCIGDNSRLLCEALIGGECYSPCLPVQVFVFDIAIVFSFIYYLLT